VKNSRLIINRLFFTNKSTVAKNFYALSILQSTNYIFPIITIPYVTRILGPEVFGLLNFASSIIAYLWLLINYGFDLSASREIAQNRNNKIKINEIFNRVLFSKLYLFLFATIIFIIVLFFVNKVEEHKLLYIILFFGGIFNIFFPTWYFQGIEKLNFTSIFTFIIRLVFTFLIFILIKNENDYLYYPIATIAGQILVSAIAMYVIIKNFKISIFVPKYIEIKNTLKDSLRIFITTIVINLYTTTNFVILGFLAGTYEVGIFTAAHKIVIIFMSIISAPLGQALYPNIGHAFSQSYEMGIQKIYKAIGVIIPITVVPSLMMFFFPDIFITLIFGNKYYASISTLRILSFVPFIVGLSNIFGIQGLLNLKKDNLVIAITLIGAVLGLTLNFILVPLFRQNGTAISWVITEAIITFMMFLAFSRYTNIIQDFKKLIKV